LSDSRRLRGGQPLGDTTLAGVVDRVCTYCDAYAARLKTDAQPVDDAAKEDLEELISELWGYDTALAEYVEQTLKDARAEVDLLRDQVVAKGEAHARAVRDYNRVCRQLEVDGKIHDATVERLTARVGELEGLLELRHKDHECPLKNEYQCPYVENRHGHDGDVETAYRTQCATVERVTDELATARSTLGNLLAVIFRDGGQRAAELGDDAGAKAAAVVVALFAEVERLKKEGENHEQVR